MRLSKARSELLSDEEKRKRKKSSKKVSQNYLGKLEHCVEMFLRVAR